MESITSVLITLFFVVTDTQSALVTKRPQVSTARPRADKSAQTAYIGTQPSKSISDNDISNLIEDEEVATFARSFVDAVDSYSERGYFEKMTLSTTPGYKRIMVTRRIINIKVILNILRGLYEGSRESGETEFIKTTNQKITPALLNGMIERLQPKPCLREFVRAFFEDNGISEGKIKGATCHADDMYNSQWYGRSCRDVLERSGEDLEAFYFWCGAAIGEEDDDLSSRRVVS